MKTLLQIMISQCFNLIITLLGLTKYYRIGVKKGRVIEDMVVKKEIIDKAKGEDLEDKGIKINKGVQVEDKDKASKVIHVD